MAAGPDTADDAPMLDPGGSSDMEQIDGLGLPVTFGLVHQIAPGDLRDRVFIDDQTLPAALEELNTRLQNASQAAASSHEKPQALIASTCDRVEIIGLLPENSTIEDVSLFVNTCRTFLAERSGETQEAIKEFETLHSGLDALTRVATITASLESAVVGETQITGQMRAALHLSQESELGGPRLERMLNLGFQTAKRVRTETKIGEHPVSMAAVALEVARSVHGDLANTKALLIGVGDMGELLGQRLLLAGLQHLTIMHPVARRAESLTRRMLTEYPRFDGRVTGAELSQYGVEHASADIVIAALGAGQTTVHRDNAKQAIRKRRRQPVFYIDVAVPAEIDADVEKISEAFVYGLADLERLALDGKRNRAEWIEQAHAIVAEEVTGFLSSQSANDAGPALENLRNQMEAIRTTVLDDLGTGTAPEAHAIAARATRLLMNRLLHRPAARLRALSESGQRDQLKAISAVLETAFNEIAPGCESARRTAQENNNAGSHQMSEKTAENAPNKDQDKQ